MVLPLVGDDDTAVGQHDDDGRAGRGDAGEQLNLRGGQLERLAVEALALEALGQAEEEQDGIRGGGRAHGLGRKGLVEHLAGALEALRVAECDLGADRRSDGVERVTDACRVDL